MNEVWTTSRSVCAWWFWSGFWIFKFVFCLVSGGHGWDFATLNLNSRQRKLREWWSRIKVSSTLCNFRISWFSWFSCCMSSVLFLLFFENYSEFTWCEALFSGGAFRGPRGVETKICARPIQMKFCYMKNWVRRTGAAWILHDFWCRFSCLNGFARCRQHVQVSSVISDDFCTQTVKNSKFQDFRI